MRKSYVALAVLALAALASCQENEFRNDPYIPGEGEIVFKIANSSKSTKASDGSESATFVTGQTFPMGTYGDESFYLEETVTRLDEVPYAPMTKGIPGYTENFDDLYGGFNAATYRAGEDEAYETDGRFVVADPEKLIYKRKYGDDLWDADKGIYFFLRAGEQTGDLAGVSDLTYYPKASGDTEAGSISFHYAGSSLETAYDMKDILFTSRLVKTESEYNQLISKDEGVPVLFHHALTGVKFRVGNNNSNTTKTIITRVEISGLKDEGDCLVEPKLENGGYADVSDVYSSAEAVSWSNLKKVKNSYYQVFDNPNYVPADGAANSDGTVDYEDDGTFGSSWYSAAADKNLNAEDGSLTFWFIPQELTSDVKLTVTFVVKTPDTPKGNNNGEEIVHTIDFGAQLAEAGVEWMAGELRTYTLNPNDIGVGIFDEMTDLKKDNLHVTNTGNVSEYVRVMVIGNWYGWESEKSKEAGDEPSILVGYTTDGSDGTNVMVRPWFREDAVYGQGFDSTFPMGRPAAGRTDWVRGTGSYFYYTTALTPGQTISGTNALFKSYELSEDLIPDIYIPTRTSNVREKAVGVHLVMEIVTQAVGSVKSDGTPFASCWEAWSNAINGDTDSIKPKN